MAKRVHQGGDLVLAFSETCDLSPADVGIALPAQCALSQVPNAFPLYHHEYGRRHPLAAYNVALANVCQRGLGVCEQLVGFVVPHAANPKLDDVDRLLDAQDGFLDANMEYMDDCKQILLSFRPKADPRRFPALDVYQQAVQDYRDHIGDLVNHIKHRQGRLRYLEMTSAHLRVPGYWVEEVKATGAVGPHDRFHPGGQTAFSFARNLRYHAASVAWVSTQLARAVESLVPIARQQMQPSADSTTLGFYQAVSTLPGYVFPDEVSDPWPLISAPRQRGRRKRTITIEYPAVRGSPLSLMRGRMNAIAGADGVTRMFQMPYLGAQGWIESVRRNPDGKGLI